MIQVYVVVIMSFMNLIKFVYVNVCCTEICMICIKINFRKKTNFEKEEVLKEEKKMEGKE
jgi:hypothetical protein